MTRSTAEGSEQRVEVHPGCEAIVRFDPDRSFHCVDECTWCCHHGVLLYDPDIFGLADHASLAETTTEQKGERFTTTETKNREQHVGADGTACHFLNGDGKCSLHAEHDWKPTRCSVFPLEIDKQGDDIIVDIRGDAEQHCEGMDVGSRRLIDHLDAFLPPTVWDVTDPTTGIEL